MVFPSGLYRAYFCFKDFVKFPTMVLVFDSFKEWDMKHRAFFEMQFQDIPMDSLSHQASNTF